MARSALSISLRSWNCNPDCVGLQNKKQPKGGKGGKKKVIDPFTRKGALNPRDSLFELTLIRYLDWDDIRAPNMFEHPDVGKALVNRSTGLSA